MCPVSSPLPQSIVWPALSTLHSCNRLVLINHLTLHPFDQSMWYPEWEQITSTILLSCWPSSCLFKVSAQCTLVPLLKKVSVDAVAALSHCLAFHTLQASGKSRVYPSHSQCRPTSSPSSRCCQDLPRSLALSRPETTALSWVHCLLCVCLLPLPHHTPQRL